LYRLLAGLLMYTAPALVRAAPIRVEAETGVLTGVTVATTPPGYSGTGVVVGFDNAADNITLTVAAPAGLYKLSLGYNAPYGDKNFDLSVNGVAASGVLVGNGSGYGQADAGTFLLPAGSTTIVVKNGWGYYNIDYAELTPTTVALPAAVPATLADPQALPVAKALFDYLHSLQGTKVLAGQHADPQDTLADIRYIIKKTGKEPALGCFDLMEYSPSRRQFGSNPTGYTEQYLAWAAKDQGRGIVSVMWHWNAPADLFNSATNPWWRGFYTDASTFNIQTVMADTLGLRYGLLVRDIDSIAAQLKKFQRADIPVLWRPLHEAPGGWFWWGAHGPAPYKALWRLLYRRLTLHHQLHNLIWVYSTSQNPSADWYPGDAYVDIAGPDLYLAASATMSGDWNGFQTQLGGRKLVALPETGNLPDPDNVRAYATWWSWFSVWSGSSFIRQQPLDLLRRVYTDADVITRDELPNWRATPLAAHAASSAAEVLSAYPNPAGGATLTTTLTLPKAQVVRIELTTAMGKQVFSADTGLRAGPNTLEVPTGHLGAGVYLLMVRAADQPPLTKRIVITR
jgi:mannan endo-1,4-beta-mannosidase